MAWANFTTADSIVAEAMDFPKAESRRASNSRQARSNSPAATKWSAYSRDFKNSISAAFVSSGRSCCTQ